MARLAVSCSGQFDTFREIVNETFLGIDFDARPAADGFRAQFQSRSVGSVLATLARSVGIGGVSAHRDRQRIVAEPDDYMVFMMVRGGCIRHTQYGRTADTPPGYMVLIDSREAYHVEYAGATASLNVRVPTALLRGVLGAPERYCGMAIDGRSGLNAVLSDSLLSVWRRAQGLSPDDASVTTARVIEAVASLCGSARIAPVADANAGTLHFSRAKRYIEAQLGDPMLDPSRIAAALRVSTGHLHAVMRSHGTSAGKLILGTRLDRCRDALADARLRNRTITCIALDWGFTDSAHFSKSFKARFGATPRQYRARALPPAASVRAT